MSSPLGFRDVGSGGNLPNTLGPLRDKVRPGTERTFGQEGKETLQDPPVSPRLPTCPGQLTPRTGPARRDRPPLQGGEGNGLSPCPRVIRLTGS